MRIFISWSGPLGYKIGEEFRNWLPSVLQAVNPYFSPEDIGKGSRWADEISGELDQCKFGIVILDKNALSSSWVSFEAGALSKKIGKSRLTPILIGIETTDVTGPLVQFQSCKLERSEIKKLLADINMELGEHKLEPEVFNRVFDKWYPEFESNTKAILKEYEENGSDDAESRPDREILEEILSLTRDRVRGRTLAVPTGVVDDLYKCIEHLDSANFIHGPDPHIALAAKHIARPTKYLIERKNTGLLRGKPNSEYIERIDEILSSMITSDLTSEDEE